jgi:hypothetical protein
MDITSLTKIIYADKHFFGFLSLSENDSSDLSSLSYLSLSMSTLDSNHSGKTILFNLYKWRIE